MQAQGSEGVICPSCVGLVMTRLIVSLQQQCRHGGSDGFTVTPAHYFTKTLSAGLEQ